MKITIDTKEDSDNDIRKVISLLSNLIGESGYSSSGSESPGSGSSSNIFEDNSPGVENAFGAMFGSDNSGSEPASEPSEASAASEPTAAAQEPAPSPSSPMDIFSSPAEESPAEPQAQSQPNDSDEITEEERKAAEMMMEY